MANEALLNLGTTLTLKATGTVEILSEDEVYECVDDVRDGDTDDPGYPLGIFELDLPSATPFSGTPGAGAALHIYERRTGSDGNSAPAVATDYLHDYLYTFNVDNDNSAAQQFVSPPLPICRTGAKYVVHWVPVTASVSVDGDWVLKLTPVTYGT